MTGATMKQETIFGCVPCADGVKKGFTPYKDSTVAKCSRCDIEVWVGPEQKKQQEACGYPIVCLHCVLKEYGPDAVKRLQPLTMKGQGE